MSKKQKFLSNIIGYAIPHGSHHDPLGKEGLAMVVGESYRFGTKKYPDPSDIFFEIEKTGASFGVNVTRENTYIYMSVPSENAASAKKLLDEIVNNVQTTEDSLDKVIEKRTANIEQINSNDRERAANDYSSLVLKERKQEGSAKSLRKITLKEVEKLQGKYKSNAYFFSLAEPDKLKFSDEFESGSGCEDDFQEVSESHLKLLERDIEQKVVFFGYPSVGFRQLDLEVMKVASAVMYSGLSGLTMEVIREQNSAAYYAFYIHMTMSNKGGSFISAGISEDNIVKVTKLMRNLYERGATGDFEDERLEVAKKYYLGKLDRVYDSIESLTFSDLSYALNGMKIPNYDQIVERINSVSKKDVVHYFEQMVSDRSPYMVVNGSLSKEQRSKLENEFNKYV